MENGPLPSGRAVCAWYKSESQSTCDVDRLIGIVKRHIKVKHADVGSTLLRDRTTVEAFGPLTKEELAIRKREGGVVYLEPTEYLRRVTKIGVKTFGRRHCVNHAARKDRDTTREKKAGTDKCVAEAAAQAKHALVRKSNLSEETLVAGLPMRALAGPGEIAGRTRR